MFVIVFVFFKKNVCMRFMYCMGMYFFLLKNNGNYEIVLLLIYYFLIYF